MRNSHRRRYIYLFPYAQANITLNLNTFFPTASSFSIYHLVVASLAPGIASYDTNLTVNENGQLDFYYSTDGVAGSYLYYDICTKSENNQGNAVDIINSQKKTTRSMSDTEVDGGAIGTATVPSSEGRRVELEFFVCILGIIMATLV